MRTRHELLPLLIPVLLCVAAWAVLLARPAGAVHVAPQPRQRVELQRPARRPPSPMPWSPAAPAPLTEPATPTPEPALTDGPTGGPVSETLSTEGHGRMLVEFGDVIYLGGSGDYDWEWSDEGLRWRRWMYYRRRDWTAHRRAIIEARRRRSSAYLAPGAAGPYTESDDARSSLCGAFSAACGAGGSTAAPRRVVRAAEAPAATVRREGRLWRLENGIVEATIDPDALCALAVTRRGDGSDDALPPLTLDTPSAAPCEVTETAPPDTAVDRGAVAVALTWRGNGWWQQAVVSLADGASGPEASVTRTEGARATSLLNLTGSELTWTLDGREVSVAPGREARVTR